MRSITKTTSDPFAEIDLVNMSLILLESRTPTLTRSCSEFFDQSEYELDIGDGNALYEINLISDQALIIGNYFNYYFYHFPLLFLVERLF